MGVQPPDGPLEDTSDLAELWNQALEDFKGNTKLDLTKMQYHSMQEAMDSTTDQKVKFSDFRHDGGKVDAVRSLLGNNLNAIQKVVTGAKMAADAASVFPPALPGAILMTAFTVVFQTFKDVKADYDRVSGFFNEMGSFFDRISMLESKSPKLGPFDRCIRKVFSAMLTISGIAADYKSKGRFKKWAKNLVDGGGDPKLAGAYAGMEDAIAKLGQAGGIATLRTAVEVKEITTRIDGKTDTILVSQEEIKSMAAETRDGMGAVREGVEGLDLKMGGLQRTMTMHNDGIARIEAQMKQQAALMAMMNGQLKQSNTEKQGEVKAKKPSKDKKEAGSKRFMNLGQVKRHFADGAEARKKIRAQRKEIAESFVDGTTNWIFDNSTYKKWAVGELSALWIAGDAGTGKSYIAHSVASSLEDRRVDHASVASFFFREDQEDLRSFRNALRCAVLQIAETSAHYAEKVAAEISKENADDEPWSQFFASRFPANSESRLYLILDGVDEANQADKEVIAALVQQLASAQLNINVLFTGRTDLDALFTQATPDTIHLSKDQIYGDMKTLIAARMRSLPRIRKFHRQTRRRIEQKLLEKADSMLYIEHMLRRLSAIGRETAVLKDIEKNMPDTLEGLYKLMLAECQRGRTQAQYETLRTLFAMLAYSERPLTLDEASDLVALTDPQRTFDIEDEVIGRSARLLDLGRDREDEDDDHNDATEHKSDENDHGSGDNLDQVLSESGKTPLSFQERSLRQYFQAINVEENGLRTPPTHAHLIILELLVKLLTAEIPADADKSPRLQSYAAHYWAQHFVEIEVSAENAPTVLNALYRIFSGENNVAACFETYKAPQYDVLEQQTSAGAKLKAWCELSQNLETLDASIKRWAADLVEHPEHTLLPLARSHVRNVFEPDSKRPIDEVFAYARTALETTGLLDFGEDEKLGVLKVLEYFTDVDTHSVDAYRAIAHVLMRRGQYEPSEEYCRKSLALEDANVKNRFRTRWVLAYDLFIIGQIVNNAARNQAGQEEMEEADEDEGEATDDVPTAEMETSNVAQGDTAGEQETQPPSPGNPKVEEALQEIARALELKPEGWETDARWPIYLEGVIPLKAECLRYLNRPKEALEAWTEYRTARPKGENLTGAMLNSMISVKSDWSDDTAGYFDIIDSWTPNERVKWMEYLMTTDFFGTSEHGWKLFQYAKQQGDRGKTTTIGLYEEYLRSVRGNRSKMAAPRDDLAYFYRIVVKDLKKATDYYLEVLNEEYTEDDSDIVENILHNSRQRLCDLLFERFRGTSDPREKVKLLDTLRNLPQIKVGEDDDEDEAAKRTEDDLNESPYMVILAIMTRTVGSQIEYQDILEKLFQTCVDGLSDSIGYNDSTSFRLLAKALAGVPGLERDAQIALSCQYSITDPDVEHVNEEDDEEGSAADGEDEEEEITEGAEVNTETDKAEVTIKTTNIEVTKPPFADATAEVSTKVEQLTLEDADGANSNEDEAADAAEDNEEEEEEEEEEDVIGDCLPDAGAYCDGNCDFGEEDWTGGDMYMCIHCANCDLCENCYEKRMGWNAGEPNDVHWEWCGRDHAYVKGPVEGWRGVKNGVLRIGDEEIEFKEWLRKLKEERWPKAWENFWKGENSFIGSFDR